MKIFLNVYSIFLGCRTLIQVEKILKGSLDSILSPSPSMKTQIMGRKICLRCKGETLLGVVNKLLKTKSLLTTPSNVLPLCLKQTFPPIELMEWCHVRVFKFITTIIALLFVCLLNFSCQNYNSAPVRKVDGFSCHVLGGQNTI